MKRRSPPQATLTTLTVQHIYTWMRRFYQQHPSPKRRDSPVYRFHRLTDKRLHQC